jgi:hypothetical protein
MLLTFCCLLESFVFRAGLVAHPLGRFTYSGGTLNSSLQAGCV